MRSLLFVPGDQTNKLDKAIASSADALILDLEDSVAHARKEAARQTTLSFLQDHRDEPDRPLLFVRINGFDTPLARIDLEAIMAGAPEGVVLPKSSNGGDVTELAARISSLEAAKGISAGATRILAIATESAAAIFGLGTYAGSSPRLSAIAWGVEDLAADIGAQANRADGDWTEPAKLVRNLCLFGAAAAGVAAIDSVFTDFRDLAGLERDCITAARDGFSGKLAIHPAQIAVINAAFTPSAEAIAHAERVVAAFAGMEGGGVTSVDGRMLDLPHLKAAERLLGQAGKGPGNG